MPIPSFRVRADFNANGDFTDSGEDITSDVRIMNHQYGKVLEKQRAEAASLDVLLNNDGHTYTPTNSASGIYPNVEPGPDIRAWMAYPLDDLDAANGTNLTGRSPSNDSLFGNYSGDTGSFEIQSNRLDFTGSDGTAAQAVLDFRQSDCFVGGDLTVGTIDTSSNHHDLLVLRRQDGSNYMTLSLLEAASPIAAGPFLAINVISGGSRSETLTDNAISWDDNETKFVIVRMSGNEYDIWADGTLIAGGLTPSDSSFQDNTDHGFGGLEVRTDSHWDNFGGWSPTFSGRIDRVDPRPEPGRQYAFMQAFDDFERLKDYQVFRKAPAAVANVADIVGEILDAAEFPSSDRILDNGTNLTQDANHEKSISGSVLDMLYQAQDDEVGFIYIDGAGTMRLEASDHLDSAPHTSPVATWETPGANNDQTDVEFERLSWDNGKERVENIVFFTYFLQSVATVTEVWRLDETFDIPSLNDGQTKSFLALGTQTTGVFDPITPIPIQDYQLNSQSDGNGTDLTAILDSEQGTVSMASDSVIDDTGQDFTEWNDGKHLIVITDASESKAMAVIARNSDTDGDGTKVTLKDGPDTTDDLPSSGLLYSDSGFDRTDTPLTYDVFASIPGLETGFEGNSRLVNITNHSGTDGFITLLRLRAAEVTKSGEIGKRSENTDSQNNVGPRRVKHESLFIDTEDVAQGRADERLRWRHLPKERLELVMRGGTREALMNILHRQVSDRVRIVFSDMGLDRTYFIQHRALSIQDGGADLECTWTLERVVGVLFDSGQFGFAQFG